jgi:hypothetical protein
LEWKYFSLDQSTFVFGEAELQESFVVLSLAQKGMTTREEETLQTSFSAMSSFAGPISPQQPTIAQELVVVTSIREKKKEKNQIE